MTADTVCHITMMTCDVLLYYSTVRNTQSGYMLQFQCIMLHKYGYDKYNTVHKGQERFTLCSKIISRIGMRSSFVKINPTFPTMCGTILKHNHKNVGF